MPQYVPGDSVELRVSFLDSAEAFVDPDTVNFLAVDPDGIQTAYEYAVDVELVKEDVGRFLVYLLLNKAGYWRVRWTGSGTLAAAEETSIVVCPSLIT